MHFGLYSQSYFEVDLYIYVYFNREKPNLNKCSGSNGNNMSLSEINFPIQKSEKKQHTKYQFINRIHEILNDENECEEMRRIAVKIKNKRLKEVIEKAQSQRSKNNLLKRF